MRILVAMSGGVDSSVVAGLLKDQGHEVIGVTMKLWEGENGEMPETGCCTASDSEDARKVAGKLDIPYYVLDYTDSFSDSVVDNFIEMYSSGLTPNPCIECNRSVKFDHFLDQANELGCDKVATGHYAKIVRKNNHLELHRADYKEKDQSYVLHMLTEEKLDRILFPLGTISKPEVRQMAANLGLKTAFKKDSQDICFVPNGDYVSVIEKFRPDAFKKGNIKDINGKVIGVHEGVINFTIGQRKGIKISSKEPLYVIDIKAKNNSIIVGSQDFLNVKKLYLRDINLLSDMKIFQKDVFIKVRSTGKLLKAKAIIKKDSGIVEILQEERGISPGQACVFYSRDNLGERVLGGGWIDKTINKNLSTQLTNH